MALPAPVALLPTALPGGVLASARPLGAGWENGVEFTSDSCLAPERVAICPERYSGTLGEVGPQTFLPFDVRQGVKCSSLTRMDVAGKAGAVIDVTTEYVIGQELQTGTASGNPNLEDAVSIGTATDLAEAISWLEETGAASLAGRLIVLHIPPRLAVYLPDSCYRDASGWHTALGSQIILSPGYTGATVWATGEIYAAVGPIVSQARMDRALNTDEGWAERPAIVVFDPCFLVSVDTPYDGPTSPA